MKTKSKPAPKAKTPEAAEVVQLLPTSKVLISDLNTRHPTHAEVKSSGLVDSIRSHQITPCIGRPHPTKKGCIELLAGARRRTACEVLGIPVRIVVRDISDEDFEDMILTDNLQREDPDPLAEAILVKRRLDAGAKPKEIAAKYGQTALWVQRRARLANLCPELVKAWKDRQSDFFGWAVEMMEHLALFDHARQLELMNEWAVKGADDVKDLRSATERMSCKLNVPWLDDPDTFTAGCGPGCAQDSAKEHTLLGFGGDKKECSNCLNPTCFRLRSGLASDAAASKLLAKLKISPSRIKAAYFDSYQPHASSVLSLKDGEDAVVLNVVRKHELNGFTFTALPTKQTPKPDQLLALCLDKPLEPKVVLMKAEKGSKLSKKLVGKTTDPAAAQAEKVATLQGRRWSLVRNRLREALDKAKDKAPVHLTADYWVALAGQFGLQTRNDYISNREASEESKVWNSIITPALQPPLCDSVEAIWSGLRPVLSQRLFHIQRAEDFKSEQILTELRGVASLIGFDLDAAKRQVDVQDLPIPKSWGTGLDPHTCLPATVQPTEAGAIAPEASDNWKSPGTLKKADALLKGPIPDVLFAIDKQAIDNPQLLRAMLHKEKMGKARKALIDHLNQLINPPALPADIDDEE